MTAYIVAVLALVVPVLGAYNWTDFADNFATDLAPLVALFGEQVTKQFLSESTSFLDNIIFALAPLGVLTAVVSVIRVCGNASLKAFIGRAQEAHGIAEAELCSSTSRDVCELWSNGGISRVFGRPKVLEFVYSGGKDFYPDFLKLTASKQNQGKESLDDGVSQNPSCGIHIQEDFLCPKQSSKDSESGWRETNPKSKDPRLYEEPLERRFAPHPNLSLNIGIRSFPQWLHWLIAIFGFLLQSSFFGYATWASYYAPELWENGKPPQKWAFPLATIGTGLLVIGMGLCAMLIERRTDERKFENSATSGTMMFWLQPGGQSVGDQIFNAFAYWEPKSKYVTSWRVEGDTSTYALAVWPAIIFTMVGFVFQFVGLRALHGSVALYQLAATIVMAIIRAALRSKRIDEKKNPLKDNRDVEGHELDWIALEIDSAVQKNTQSRLQPKHITNAKRYWYLVDREPNHEPSNFEKGDRILPSRTTTWRDMIGFLPETTHIGRGDEKSNDEMSIEYICASRAVEWIQSHENKDGRPNEAAKVMRYRCRLAYLTDDRMPEEERRWRTEIRESAEKLKKAIEAVATHIFSGEISLLSNWKDVQAVAWPLVCQTHTVGEPQRLNVESLPVYFLLYRDNGRWVISKHQLEAVLGLWLWSKKHQSGSKRFFKENILMVAEESEKEELKAAMHLWITQTLPIIEEQMNPHQILQITQPLMLSAAASRHTRNSTRGNLVALSTPTTVPPLELVTHSIFAAFINKIADIVEPLENVEPRAWKRQGAIINLGISTDKPFIGLTEPNVELLVEKFINVGLGTREDALMSIIPSLLQKEKLHLPKEIARRLAQAAQVERRSNNLDKCEEILRGALQMGHPSIETLAIRGLGELYRYTVKSHTQSDREFGRRVASELSRIKCVSNGGKEAQKHYRSVAEYENSGQIGNQNIQFNKPWENLKHDLSREKARPFGLLLTKKYDVSKAPRDRVSMVIEWAIKQNCSELIEDLWEVTKYLKDIWDSSIHPTPLFRAVEIGCDAETFQLIIDWPGVKTEWHNGNGVTSLVMAAAKGYAEHVRALLKAGADVNTQGSEKYGNALQAASIEGHGKIAELLLDNGADANAQCGEEYGNALQAASVRGHSGIVELLLINGARVNAQSGKGYGNALQGASAEGHINTTKLLLDKGANVNTQGGYYGNALQAASAKGHSKIVKLLLERGADANAQSSEEYGNALQAASAKGYGKIIKLLLEKGADVNAQSSREYGNALQAASARGHGKIVELLLNKGADINTHGGYYGNALQAASAKGHIDIVKLLLSKDADINAQNGTEYGTALQAASVEGYSEIVELLLDEGADVNAQGGKYSTALKAASAKGYDKIVQLLRNKGAKSTPLETKE
ncbi:hypothetical protein TWF694_010101 [Orbilia ellipsospora]|uniref:Ankyrin repeat protein n=1 Tax=Orbilia ellipsospora TaxID=2528407 RepID=A0AAV9XA92_9PEZI